MNLLSSLTKYTCTALPTNPTWCTEFVSFFAGNRIVRGKMCACLSHIHTHTHIYRNELRMYCMAAHTPHASAVASVVVEWVSSFRWWAQYSCELYTWADVWVVKYRTVHGLDSIEWKEIVVDDGQPLKNISRHLNYSRLNHSNWPTQADRFCKMSVSIYLFFQISKINHTILPHFFAIQNGIEHKSMKMNAIVWPTQWHNYVVHTIHHLFVCVGLNVKER